MTRNALVLRAVAVVPVLIASLVTSTPASAAPARANGLIVFERELPAGDHTQTDIWTVHGDGTRPVALTHTDGRNEFGPVWSPDGRLIAFWRTPAPFGPGTLWVMAADGSGQRQLTTGIDARDPTWNPAGTKLTFSQWNAHGADLWSLRVSDGGDRHRLTSGHTNDFEPAWSPDGSTIAFTRGRGQNPGDLVLLRLSTGAVTPVVRAGAYEHQATWRPDGTEIVFESDTGNTATLVAVRPAGHGAHALTDGGSFDTGPAVAPDGTAVVFGSDRGSLLSQLWIAGADGSNPHQLVTLSGGAGNPDWQTRPAQDGNAMAPSGGVAERSSAG